MSHKPSKPKGWPTEAEFSALLDKTCADFSAETANWKLSRYDADSPPLPESVRELLVHGVRDIMQGFKYAEENRAALDALPAMPQRMRPPGGSMRGELKPQRTRHAITRSVPAALLMQKLEQNPEILAYAQKSDNPEGVKDEICSGLLGCAIRKALDATPHLIVKGGAVPASLC